MPKIEPITVYPDGTWEVRKTNMFGEAYIHRDVLTEYIKTLQRIQIVCKRTGVNSHQALREIDIIIAEAFRDV